mgnify:CR=1 FL=1
MKVPALSPRKKEVFLTVATNLSLQVVTALCGFVLPPLVIGTFGSSVNGMVSSISQFIAYLNIVEAGVGGASIAALYRPLALGDTAERNAILSATARFYNRSGVLFTLLIFALAFVYPLIVGGQVDRTQSALMVLVLGITGAAEFFLIGKYRVLLTADKKVYVISLVQMAALTVSTALSVALIKAGIGIVAVKLVSALVYLGRYVFLALYVQKRYAGLDFHAAPDTQAISQSRNVLVHQVGSLIVFNSPLIIITIFCSLKDASVYTVYAMVFSAVNQLLGSFSNGMQSFFGESLVTDAIERTRALFSRYETIFFLVEGWFYSMAYLLIMPFMHLYTAGMSDAEYMQPTLATLFVAVGVLNNVRNPAVQLINAAGHFRRTQWRSAAEAVINVACSAAGVLLFGFQGVLLGAVCSGLYRGTDLILYASRHILRSARAGVLSFAKIAGSALVYLLACRLLQAHAFAPPSFLHWIFQAAGYGVVLSVPVGVILLSRKAVRKRTG